MLACYRVTELLLWFTSLFSERIYLREGKKKKISGRLQFGDHRDLFFDLLISDNLLQLFMSFGFCVCITIPEYLVSLKYFHSITN